MKSIVYLFALLALGSGLPLSSENEEQLVIPVDTERQITPEQKQCLADSLEQIVNDNPQLDWWFDALNQSSQNIAAKAEKCKELENRDQQRGCYRTLFFFIKAEKVRLLLILPKNERPIIGVINRAVKSCLRDQTNFIDDDFEIY